MIYLILSSLFFLGCHAAEKSQEFTMDVTFKNTTPYLVTIAHELDGQIVSSLKLDCKKKQAEGRLPVTFILGVGSLKEQVYKGRIRVELLSKNNVIDQQKFTVFLDRKPQKLEIKTKINESQSLLFSQSAALKIIPIPFTNNYVIAENMYAPLFKTEKKT